MYTREEREGILWEFRQSGLSVPEACRRLPLFPTRANLYRWLRMEEAGELAATEMPDRAARMHCAHGEGSARFAARSRRVRGEAEVEGPEQADWLNLPRFHLHFLTPRRRRLSGSSPRTPRG